MNALHVLLIEDSQTYAQLVRAMLDKATMAEFEVACADSLSSGLELLGEGDFDAILLDLTLPDSQGLDTLKRVRNASSSLPILILSSHDEEELTLKALHFGAADYLVKSEVNANWLARSVIYAIERNRRTARADSKTKSKPKPPPLTVKETDASDDTLAIQIDERRLVGVVELEAAKDRLLKLAEQQHAKRLMLDFGQVEYVSNIAISMLLKVHKQLQADGCQLVLVNVSSQVFEHFATRRFDRIFEIIQPE